MKRDRAEISDSLLPTVSAAPVEWLISDQLVGYQDAVDWMDARVAAIADGRAAEAVWLLEHPPLYTAGTSADAGDLIAPDRFPVYRTGRGGQYTYHGPGQRIAYVMLDLKRRTVDVRRYIAALEGWIIATLDALNVRGERREDRVGVWVKRPEKAPGVFPGEVEAGSPSGNAKRQRPSAEDKVAAIGVRVRRSVTLHGISLNVAPDLEHFSGIVPCGISGYGVTSLEDLGILISLPEVDSVLRGEFEKRFGPTVRADRDPVSSAEAKAPSAA